jgi:hypothetical protein
MYSGKPLSILASASAEEGHPERFLERVGRFFLVMDGGETWRGAGIFGVSAMYPGAAPAIPENMAGRNPRAIWQLLKSV